MFILSAGASQMKKSCAPCVYILVCEKEEEKNEDVVSHSRRVASSFYTNNGWVRYRDFCLTILLKQGWYTTCSVAPWKTTTMRTCSSAAQNQNPDEKRSQIPLLAYVNSSTFIRHRSSSNCSRSLPFTHSSCIDSEKKYLPRIQPSCAVEKLDTH